MLVKPRFAAVLCVTEDYKCIILLELTKRMKGNVTVSYVVYFYYIIYRD